MGFFTSRQRVALALVAVSLCAAGCGYSLPASTPTHAHATVVQVKVTPAGCDPVPAQVPAGNVEIAVTNLDATTVSEVELLTGDLSDVLGERENLIQGLSGSFSVRLKPGQYVLNCPGAARQHWPLSVSTSSGGQ